MEEKNDQWAIVELFGHTKIAGKISESVIGGCSFVRVDVPGFKDHQPFTKLYGQGAIYSISFVDEETAMYAVNSFQETPIDKWSARQMVESQNIALSNNHGIEAECEDEDEDEIPY